MYDEYVTLDQALVGLNEAEAEILADRPDLSLDEVYSDLVTMIVYSIPDDVVAREFCRTTLGYVPFEHVARLGDVDWIT